jgi:hypothetical protein
MRIFPRTSLRLGDRHLGASLSPIEQLTMTEEIAAMLSALTNEFRRTQERTSKLEKAATNNA